MDPLSEKFENKYQIKENFESFYKVCISPKDTNFKMPTEDYCVDENGKYCGYFDDEFDYDVFAENMEDYLGQYLEDILDENEWQSIISMIFNSCDDIITRTCLIDPAGMQFSMKQCMIDQFHSFFNNCIDINEDTMIKKEWIFNNHF